MSDRRAEPERYQWHKEVHVQWAKERLFFWRLGFWPTYDRRRVKDALMEVFDRHRVCAYAVYELFGDWDLLVRAWLPTTSTQEGFENTLSDRLKPEHLQATEQFSVDRILRHWVWHGSDGMSRPSDDVLLTPLADSAIDRINRGTATPDELEEAETSYLIASARHTRGIRFAMVVTPPFGSSRVGDELDRRVLVVMNDAHKMHVVDGSVYKGLGFGRYLILGRVDYSEYRRIREEVADRINTEISPVAHGARTYTMLIPSEDFLLFKDDLRLASELREAEPMTAARALTEPESESVEVKGSAFIDLGRWLQGDGELAESPKVANGGVLKAITGMLNADGGVVVIGAVEARQPDPRSQLADRVHVGGYVLTGIEMEFRADGWDGFERRLRSLMSSRIQPDPQLWVTTTLETVEQVPLCRIVVRKPDRDWYYLNRGNGPEFFVRQGGSTNPLDGPDADRYRRSRPRG